MSEVRKAIAASTPLFHDEDELPAALPAGGPLSQSLSGIFNFLRLDALFWQTLESLRDKYDAQLERRKVMDVVSMLHVRTGSDDWYAVQVARLCDELLVRQDEAQRVDHEYVMRSCIMLGHILAEREWRRQHGTRIIRKLRSEKGASRGGVVRAALKAVETKKTLTYMAEKLDRKPGAGVSWAAQEAKKAGLGASPLANVRLWNRHRSK